jgi:hypothetical protein
VAAAEEPPVPRAPEPPVRQRDASEETEQSLLHLFASGYEAVVVCGPSASGKSELVRGFTRANAIVRGRAQLPAGTLGPLGGTPPGEVWFQPIDGAKKRVFVDPAGEFFTTLSPQRRRHFQLPEPTSRDLDFIRHAVRCLAGIVLVIDLTRMEEADARKQWTRQEYDMQFLLQALRWLRFGEQDRQEELGLALQISASAGSLPRLDVPVLVMFTKADLLVSYTNEVPREFARRELPLLHGAVRTNARRYRYDFCHTMVRGGDGDRPVALPCGVLLSLEWLLDPPLGWMPRLPARFWETP